MLRVAPSEKDFDLIYQSNSGIHQSYDYTDWEGIVVNKPWGYEYEWFSASKVSIWFLFIKQGFSTSFHSHPRKGTSLIPLVGQLSLRTIESEFQLDAETPIYIQAATFHQSTALSERGCYLLEVESPAIKEDLVRMEDHYGRKGIGYEGNKSFSYEREAYLFSPFKVDDFSQSMNLLDHVFCHLIWDPVEHSQLCRNDWKWAVCLDRVIPNDGGVFEIGELFGLNKEEFFSIPKGASMLLIK